MSLIIFLIHLFSTLYMTGLIWFVQVVHYPLHGEVGEAQFRRYQELHMQKTSFVVTMPMILELASSIYLVANPYPNTPDSIWIFGIVMLSIIWASTALLQVPVHSKLVHRFSVANHRKLVISNWLRTVFWTGRSALLVWVLSHLLQ